MKDNWEFYAFLSSVVSIIVTSLINYISYILRRRNPLVSGGLDIDYVFQSVYKSEAEILNILDRDRAFNIPSNFSDGFRILRINITNESNKPITISEINLYDRDSTEIPYLKRYTLKMYNTSKSIDENVTLLCTILDKEKGPMGMINSIDIDNIDFFTMSPYETRVIQLGINPKHSFVKIQVSTTIIKHPFKSRCKSWRESNKESLYKSFEYEISGNNIIKNK